MSFFFSLVFEMCYIILYHLPSMFCFESVILMRQIRSYKLCTDSNSRYILFGLPKLLVNILMLGSFTQNLILKLCLEN